jgi:cytochrome c peroxidase
MHRKLMAGLFGAACCVLWLLLMLFLFDAMKHSTSATELQVSHSRYRIPQSDQACLMPGNQVNLACVLANDPDAKRIRLEEANIEAQALAQTASGKLDPSGEIVLLGKLEIYDPSLSLNDNRACAFCHDPAAGFKSGISFLNEFTGGTTPGSVRISVPEAYPNYAIAKRNPQSYAYATFAPQLQFNKTQDSFYGGNFWDGRATGIRLGNPAAEQAQGPPTDPDEMANPDPACVVWRLSRSKYKALFEKVWGIGSLSAITWPSNVAKICSIPVWAAVFHGNPAPLDLTSKDRTRASQAYDDFAQAARAYEASPLVNPFTSKFDYALAHPDRKVLSPEETAGYRLFNGKGHCNQCHLDGTQIREAEGHGPALDEATNAAPLFTDFTFNNLGIPQNTQEEPWFYEDKPDQFGIIRNPLGFRFSDAGIGLLLDGYDGPLPNQQWASLKPRFNGTFSTSTVRDVAMAPYTGFVKAYMHNGYLKSLKEVVHFYNTRDVYAYPVTSGHCPAGTVEKVTCWPEPEDSDNLNHQIGRLGLTDKQENESVAFLETLTDGYQPKAHPARTN